MCFYSQLSVSIKISGCNVGPSLPNFLPIWQQTNSVLAGSSQINYCLRGLALCSFSVEFHLDRNSIWSFSSVDGSSVGLLMNWLMNREN